MSKKVASHECRMARESTREIEIEADHLDVDLPLKKAALIPPRKYLRVKSELSLVEFSS